MQEKIKSVISWNKSPSKSRSKSAGTEYSQDYDLATQVQGYESEPFYDSIDEEVCKAIADRNSSLNPRSPLSTPPVSMPENGGQSSIYETSLPDFNESFNKQEKNVSQPGQATYLHLSSCYSSPQQANNYIPTKGQGGHVSPASITLVVAEAQVAEFCRHPAHTIPQHVSNSCCPGVDSNDWESLCDEFSEYSLQEQSQEEMNSSPNVRRNPIYDCPRSPTWKAPESSRVSQSIHTFKQTPIYDIPRNSTRKTPEAVHKYGGNSAQSEDNAHRETTDNLDTGDSHYLSPKAQFTIPRDVTLLRCPSIDEDEWGRLCTDLFE